MAQSDAERARNRPLRIYLTGVAGVGKSLLGENLASAMRLPFIEGDDYHPPANVEKMRNGVALGDDDRWPWLEALAAAGLSAASKDGAAIIACSGLKKSYRERLASGVDCRDVFVFLHGDRELIESRLAARIGHYMPVSLLDSQLDTLEPPTADEPYPVIDVSIADSPENIVDSVAQRIRELL